jgi:hypothetical protein
MSADDVLIAVGFGAFLVFLIFGRRRDRPTIPKRDAKRAVAEAIASTTAEPPPVVVERPSHRSKR